MGLFDSKKKGDDFASPVERIDLGAPRSGPVKADKAPARAPVAAPLPPEPELSPPPLRYGIAQAIELMRSLPQENVELVVQVVKRTLESAHIRIDTIVQDAARRQAEIAGRAGVLRQEIAELEREANARKQEIGQLEVEHREVSLVKDRLILAERLNAPPSSATPTNLAPLTPMPPLPEIRIAMPASAPGAAAAAPASLPGVPNPIKK